MIHLRSAVRSLLRERGFTASVVLTLTLGLGGCLAVFSIVRGVLLAPLPFPSPDRLTRVWMTNPQQGFDKDVISYPQFRDWRDQSRDVFAAMAVINDSVASLSSSGPAQEIAVSQVSEEFFSVLGANPLFGRVFAPEDYEAGRHRVPVLSHGLWTSSFGADQSIVGRTITVATEPFTVIGVMPPRITYPSDTLAWSPLAATPALRQTMESRGALWLEVIARIKPEVATTTAQAAMDVVPARYNAAYPTATPGTGIYVAPMHQDIVESVARSLWLLQGAVLAVLLIACANISNLMLARATARRREVATRIALGAGWRRIAQQCFTETLLIAAIGAAFGIAIAVALVRMLPSFAPAQVPMIDGVSIDWVVGLAAVVLTVATAIVEDNRVMPDYARIRVPVLAIYRTVTMERALKDYAPKNDQERAVFNQAFAGRRAMLSKWQRDLLAGVPTARIVELPGANLYVFVSNEADILREVPGVRGHITAVN